MTGTRARSIAQRDSWNEHALLPGRPGMPAWATVLCALGLAAAGAFADMERINRLGIVFHVCYFLGCLLAVVMVQRKGLFGPMVQPPLILAVAALGVIFAVGSHLSGEGMVATALALGTPLINSFPAMAITTAFTVAIGSCRLAIQRRPTSRHDL